MVFVVEFGVYESISAYYVMLYHYQSVSWFSLVSCSKNHKISPMKACLGFADNYDLEGVHVIVLG